MLVHSINNYNYNNYYNITTTITKRADTMSLGDRKYSWALPQLPETDELMRPVTRRPPGDYTTPEAMTMGRAELAKRKNTFFEDALSLHVVGSPRRERILGDSMVIAELKTNVIVSPVSARPIPPNPCIGT